MRLSCDCLRREWGRFLLALLAAVVALIADAILGHLGIEAEKFHSSAVGEEDLRQSVHGGDVQEDLGHVCQDEVHQRQDHAFIAHDIESLEGIHEPDIIHEDQNAIEQAGRSEGNGWELTTIFRGRS
ncbi:MAG: hypothetical protein ACM3X3_00400 [Betaproteobacteria bacterium]